MGAFMTLLGPIIGYLGFTVAGLVGLEVVEVVVVVVVVVEGVVVVEVKAANSCCSRSLRAAARASTLMLEALERLCKEWPIKSGEGLVRSKPS